MVRLVTWLHPAVGVPSDDCLPLVGFTLDHAMREYDPFYYTVPCYVKESKKNEENEC